MNKSTRIITFYSYKGGVGRSMAVMNVAYDLAAKGARVLLLDMDLEAPGLSGFLRRHKEIGRFPQRDMVDLVAWARSCYDTSAAGSSHVDPAAFPPRGEFSAGVEKTKIASAPRDPYLLGCIDIVPVDEDRDYWRRLSALGVNNFDQRALIGVGSILRAWLQVQEAEVDVPDYYGPHAERQAKYDFVLIDSRTGLSETGGLCIGPLSDELVVLTSLNDQNVEGTRHFLEEVGILERPPAAPEHNGRESLAKPKRLDPKPTMIVASPVPAGEIQMKKARLLALEKTIGPVDIRFSYHPQMALRESVFSRDYPDEYLTWEYGALATRLLGPDERVAVEEAISVALGDIEARLATLEAKAGAVQGALPVVFDGMKIDSTKVRDVLGRFLRFPGNVPPWFLSLYYGRLARKVAAGAKDADFIVGDRFFRVVSQSAGHPDRGDAFVQWADLLAKWSSLSGEPELAIARQKASLAQYGNAIAVYSSVIDSSKSASNERAAALFNRGIAFGKTSEPEKAIADYTAVIEMPDAPPESKANALFNRGNAFRRENERKKAIADYTLVVEMRDAPAEQKAKALVNRGTTFREENDLEKAIVDCTAVIEMPDAPAEQKANARVNRGVTFSQENEEEKAIADYTAVIELPDAPPEPKANALFNRGNAFRRENERKKAIADYTLIVEMRDAPAEQKAKALVSRGITFGQENEREKAVVDYTAVIEMPEAPAEQKAQAFIGRGWHHYVAGRFAEAIADCNQAVALDPQDCTAKGNMAIALLVERKTSEALDAYGQAWSTAVLEDVDDMENDLREADEKYGPLPGVDEVRAGLAKRRAEIQTAPTPHEKQAK